MLRLNFILPTREINLNKVLRDEDVVKPRGKFIKVLGDTLGSLFEREELLDEYMYVLT